MVPIFVDDQHGYKAWNDGVKGLGSGRSLTSIGTRKMAVRVCTVPLKMLLQHEQKKSHCILYNPQSDWTAPVSAG